MLARHLAALWHAQASDATTRVLGWAGEHFELDVCHRISDVDQFQINTQVGLVRTITTHRFRIGHARERIGELGTVHFLEDMPNHALDHVLHIVFFDEGELHIELGKFRLTIGAQVLIAEAARDLVVAVHAGHHQQLLEQLR